jgi:hypothetical protein
VDKVSLSPGTPLYENETGALREMNVTEVEGNDPGNIKKMVHVCKYRTGRM